MRASLTFPEPPQIVPFSFGSETVNEGDYAQVLCTVRRGDDPISISWSLKGDIVSSEPSMNTAQIGPRASILSLDSVGYRHSGTYTCTARNPAGVATHSAELRVNGRILLRGALRGMDRSKRENSEHICDLCISRASSNCTIFLRKRSLRRGGVCADFMHC